MHEAKTPPVMKLARYVAVLLAVQLALACSTETEGETIALNRAEPAASPVAEATEPQAERRLVLAFGDSLYAGYGLEPRQSFPAVLELMLAEQGLAAEVVNAGVSGDTTAGGLGRLEFTLDGLPRTPDLAIVGLGANDMLRGLDPAETRRNLDAILAELRRRDIPVMLTGMLASRTLGGDYVQRFETIYPDLARKYDAELDPFFMEGVITDRSLLLGDGLHPNAEGVRIIASRLAPQVSQLLAREKQRH